LNGGVDQLIANVTNQNTSLLGAQNSSIMQSLDITLSSAIINGLIPDTVYSVTLTIVVLGGASITSQPQYVQTMVGSMCHHFCILIHLSLRYCMILLRVVVETLHCRNKKYNRKQSICTLLIKTVLNFSSDILVPNI